MSGTNQLDVTNNYSLHSDLLIADIIYVDIYTDNGHQGIDSQNSSFIIQQQHNELYLKNYEQQQNKTKIECHGIKVFLKEYDGIPNN